MKIFTLKKISTCITWASFRNVKAKLKQSRYATDNTTISAANNKDPDQTVLMQSLVLNIAI